jgi:hypothetical protein
MEGKKIEDINNSMITKKTWEEFRNTGLLWWINTLLHTFGWAIAFAMTDDNKLIEVYPTRVKFRGFDDKMVTEGYQKVSEYLKDNIDDLLQESKE